MTGLVETLHNTLQKARGNAHDIEYFARDKLGAIKYRDIVIQFIGANTSLSSLNLSGVGDPFFVADIDHKITFTSSVKPQTLQPVWNEIWRVKNVPSHASLHVKVMNKDESPLTGFIGQFETSINPGAKGVEIESPLLKHDRGTFWLKIDSAPSESSDPQAHSFLFDGPIRYSRHSSPTVGLLTNVNEYRLYSTWKIYLKSVPVFLPDDNAQHWNVNYKAAQEIFQGPSSVAVRSGIQAAHRLLYARSTANAFGTLENKQDVVHLLHGGTKPGANAGQFDRRVKPAVYTYVISMQDNSFRFSETGAAFFVDFASKHALHSNCAECVRYSGEFHPRPKGGWESFSEDKSDEEVEWELVIDNNSGTYAPDKALLPQLKSLLEYNFPGFGVYALDREDPELQKSRDACRKYATERRHISAKELQPTKQDDTESLLSMSKRVNDQHLDTTRSGHSRISQEMQI